MFGNFSDLRRSTTLSSKQTAIVSTAAWSQRDISGSKLKHPPAQHTLHLLIHRPHPRISLVSPRTNFSGRFFPTWTPRDSATFAALTAEANTGSARGRVAGLKSSSRWGIRLHRNQTTTYPPRRDWSPRLPRRRAGQHTPLQVDLAE